VNRRITDFGSGLKFAFPLLIVCVSVWGQEASGRGTPNLPAADLGSVVEVGNDSFATYKEDFSSLSLAGSNLQPLTPVLGEKDVYPDFTREILKVEWRPSDPIYLYVMLPRNVKNPPAILYLYAYPSENDRFRDEDFSRLLIKNGTAAIGFVSALTGHRYHDRPMKEWFISELEESLGASVHDVQMIINYLSGRGDIDTGRIGMFGDGSGGTIAILAAAVDPRIKVLDLLEPWGDWPDWLAKSVLVPEEERATYLQPEFLKRVEPLDPVRWVSQLGSRTIRLQLAPYETLTPSAARARLEKAMPPKVEIVRYENSQALLQAASSGQFFDWIQFRVRSGASGPEATAALQDPATGRH